MKKNSILIIFCLTSSFILCDKTEDLLNEIDKTGTALFGQKNGYQDFAQSFEPRLTKEWKATLNKVKVALVAEDNSLGKKMHRFSMDAKEFVTQKKEEKKLTPLDYFESLSAISDGILNAVPKITGDIGTERIVGASEVKADIKSTKDIQFENLKKYKDKLTEIREALINEKNPSAKLIVAVDEKLEQARAWYVAQINSLGYEFENILKAERTLFEPIFSYPARPLKPIAKKQSDQFQLQLRALYGDIKAFHEAQDFKELIDLTEKIVIYTNTFLFAPLIAPEYEKHSVIFQGIPQPQTRTGFFISSGNYDELQKEFYQLYKDLLKVESKIKKRKDMISDFCKKYLDNLKDVCLKFFPGFETGTQRMGRIPTTVLDSEEKVIYVNAEKVKQNPYNTGHAGEPLRGILGKEEN